MLDQFLSGRLGAFVVVLFLLLALGTIGYTLIEGWSVADAFYMTAITLTTVGFGEVQPLSTVGRLFTVILIILGVGFIAYGLEYLLTASLGGEFRRRRLMRELGALQDHVIVCGYGRVGQSAVESLKGSRHQVVVVESRPDDAQAARERGITVVEGDATSDEVLLQAGVDRAWGAVICTGSDSVNLFIVLSARALNSQLHITARSDQDSESKMRLAGADRVVSPYLIGGRHMANIVIRPHVTDFLDVVTLDGGLELWLEELVIFEGSPLINQTVGESQIRKRTQVMLVAVLRHRTGTTFMPDADTSLEVGDELIVLGTREQLAALERLTSGRGEWQT